MNYLCVLATLLSSTFALSIPRQSTDLVWNVTNFLASGAPYSIETTYEFDITDGAISAHCVRLESTLPEIGYAPLTNCTNPIYSFYFGSAPSTSTTPGYNLQVWEEDPENTICGAPSMECVYTGFHFFPASDVVTVVNPDGDPNGNYDRLDTAPDFTVSYVGTHI
ncbi:hypothetical protein N0V93_005891 [Gnomoniopsis smithogilvyi]|uniref:AA1-like domain-containing protein n=1 Tax=Gnomoniopsis smithogilvyi TaxID=1191159 RepID=A0A9W8YVB6_9PEZI|nr:hypothetical protein N0V93_005891 [Gnomoniopsis smithogilvyi]